MDITEKIEKSLIEEMSAEIDMRINISLYLIDSDCPNQTLKYLFERDRECMERIDKYKESIKCWCTEQGCVRVPASKKDRERLNAFSIERAEASKSLYDYWKNLIYKN